MTQTDLSLRLDAPLAALRATVLSPAPLGPVVPGLAFHADPQAGLSGHWHSPRGRLLEVETTVTRPGRWLGLHLALPDLADLAPLVWLGLAARSGAGHAMALRVCLRSGLPEGGFHDQFFDRHLLSQPAETDHLDMIAPARLPDLPPKAPWRELILFLPPGESLRWSLHDLRLFAL
jgi:hypothetical protein